MSQDFNQYTLACTYTHAHCFSWNFNCKKVILKASIGFIGDSRCIARGTDVRCPVRGPRANRPAIIDLTLTVIGNYEKDARTRRRIRGPRHARAPSRSRRSLSDTQAQPLVSYEQAYSRCAGAPMRANLLETLKRARYESPSTYTSLPSSASTTHAWPRLRRCLSTSPPQEAAS